jgi:hypothetical protein
MAITAQRVTHLCVFLDHVGIIVPSGCRWPHRVGDPLSVILGSTRILLVVMCWLLGPQLAVAAAIWAALGPTTTVAVWVGHEERSISPIGCLLRRAI